MRKQLLFMLTILLAMVTQGAWADKPAASFTTHPAVIPGLTYTGSAQTLITAGEASGGTIKYSLDNVNWSESLPTGINWGVYTIRYYAEGDASHTDSEKQQISTIIGKAKDMYDPDEGPWTFDDVRTGWTGYEGAGTSISFDGLNDSKWLGNTYLSNDDDGCGYAYLGNTTQNSKYAVYSVYTHTENVPSYTRKVLTWNYKLLAWSSHLKQTTALYAANDLAFLETLPVDFTETYTDEGTGSGNFYHLAHLTQETAWGAETSELTGWFGFDNRNGSTAADKTSALLLTQVIGDNTGVSNYVHNWGSFKHFSSSWTTYYYKHFTFNANGGEGSMAQQTVENSGTLTANTFTRDGYVFAGWKDVNGTFYLDKASVTATESDKGPVTLYAQWVTQAEMEQYVGKVIAADGKLYKTVTAAANAGATASGVVAYVGAAGSVETSTGDDPNCVNYKYLAISLADVANHIAWCTDPSGWFDTNSTIAEALNKKDGWARTNSFGREGSRDITDIYNHHHVHAAAAAAYDYNVSRPAGSSRWFVPTMGQWNLAAQGLTGSTDDISETDNSAYTYTNISTKITAAGGSGLSWAVYWSSTEVDATNMWTFDIGGTSDGRNGGRAITVSKNLAVAEFVRAFFAFESAIPAVYTISYDANGGSSAPDAQTKDGGIDLTLSSSVPTRTGYTFAGWATTADGDVAYAAGATYTGNADQTLYAKWTENTATLAEGTNNSEWISDHAGDVYDITLTRTLQTGGWNTFSVPFSMANPSGWTVKKLNTASYADGTLTLNFTDAASIEAGKPYLVQVSANVVNPTFNDVEIVDETTATTIKGVVEFMPAINPTALPTNDKSYLFVSGGNKLTWASSGSSMKGFRAYFHILDDDIVNARTFSMNFGDDGVTGIIVVNANTNGTNDTNVYDLQGRKVQNAATKGMYVVNGKIVIIRSATQGDACQSKK